MGGHSHHGLDDADSLLRELGEGGRRSTDQVDPALTVRPGLTVVLWVAVLAIVAAAAGGVWALWPGRVEEGVARLPTDAMHADPFDAVVRSVSEGCAGSLPASGPAQAAAASPAAAEGTRAVPPPPTPDSVGRGSAARPSDSVDQLVQQALQVAAAGGGDDVPVPPTSGPSPSGPSPSGPSSHRTAPTAPPAGDDAGLVTDSSCVTVRARLLAGPERGHVQQVQVARQVISGGLTIGQRVTLARLAPRPGEPASYEWSDYARGRPLAVLGLAFLLVVLLVARWRGITALVGLALGYLAVAAFILPALRAGHDPLAVALSGSVAIMVVILYIAHGVSAKTTTALLGTVAGLCVAAGLASWASTAAQLNGTTSEDNLSLSALPGAGLRGVVLCGLVVASLGVLNDVTVTQASAVWEVAAHAPHLGVVGLARSGMRIGRDHLASTVYTIAFAYAGAALPTLMLVEMFSTPWLQILTSGQVAEEVVRTLVGAIGLVLAIPLTTAIAAVTVAAGTRRTPGAPVVPVSPDLPLDGPGNQLTTASLTPSASA